MKISQETDSLGDSQENTVVIYEIQVSSNSQKLKGKKNKERKEKKMIEVSINNTLISGQCSLEQCCPNGKVNHPMMYES